MASLDIIITYSVEMPELDEIYNKYDDPDLIDEKVDQLIDEVNSDPFYFIERDPKYKTAFDIEL